MPQSENEDEENPPTDLVPHVNTNIGSSSGAGGLSSSLEENIINMNQILE